MGYDKVVLVTGASSTAGGTAMMRPLDVYCAARSAVRAISDGLRQTHPAVALAPRGRPQRNRRPPRLVAKLMRGILIAALLATATVAMANDEETVMNTNQTDAGHPYIGLWVTDDGHVRQRLLPNGRYVEARGNREKAYQGRYEIDGNAIEYWDDTGFTADGEFVDGVLYHGGMVMRLRPN